MWGCSRSLSQASGGWRSRRRGSAILSKRGLQILVEGGAGRAAGFPDEAYRAAGAEVVRERRRAASADVLLMVRGPSANPHRGAADLELTHPGQVIIGLLNPLGASEAMAALAERSVTSYALELVPRITRAQPMDALSSMSSLAGYKAVLLAADAAPRLFPMMMTAAGTLAPARVLVLGAGVAGLQAIATAKRLGAVVEAYDVRPEAKEQVLSVGGKFADLGLDTRALSDKSGYARAQGEEFLARQHEALAPHARAADAVITTAQVPGRRAPVLVTAAMMEGMKPGSVVVDLAAEQGGNCERTRPGETVEVGGVTLLGPVNLPSTLPFHASQLYSRNVSSFLLNLLGKNGALAIRADDENRPRDAGDLRRVHRPPAGSQGPRGPRRPAARRLTRARGERHEQRRASALSAVRLRPGGGDGLPHHPARAASLAHAAHVGHQRHLRHLRRGRAARRRWAIRRGGPAPGRGGSGGGHDQRRGRIPPHRADAQDVSRREEGAMSVASAVGLAYFVASLLFIVGLRSLGSPRTARRGMHLAELGMALAIGGTLLDRRIVRFEEILTAAAIGSLIGVGIALWTPMTAMPQRTALSHAFGALAAALVGIAHYLEHGASLQTSQLVALGFEVMFGSLTVTGSLMAFGKLQEWLPGRPLTFRGQNVFNVALFTVIAALTAYVVAAPAHREAFFTMVPLAAVFGVMLVLPIGAADMPVVITLLNSYAGLAASATGFALQNNILIIAGALDGASGFILSILMCKAMNRPIANVLFGAFGKAPEKGAPPPATRAFRSATPEEAASVLDSAARVILVPGYGMAVSQAQHSVKKLADLLAQKGVDVRFAIHPVAGRMPGHMNVLLAEAGVDYDRLFDREQINDDFPQADVALVVGANDVVNPAAKTDPKSPIFGMPVLDVDRARSVMVLKRSMNPGFAGIDNELFYRPNAMMVFGDAGKTLEAIVAELKQLGPEAAPGPAAASAKRPAFISEPAQTGH